MFSRISIYIKGCQNSLQIHHNFHENRAVADNFTSWISIYLLERINIFSTVKGSFKAITVIDKNASDLLSLQQWKKYFYKRCMSGVHFLCISQPLSSYQRWEMTCFSALWAAWAPNERCPFLPFLCLNRLYQFNFKIYLLQAKLLGIIEDKREVIFRWHAHCPCLSSIKQWGKRQQPVRKKQICIFTWQNQLLLHALCAPIISVPIWGVLCKTTTECRKVIENSASCSNNLHRTSNVIIFQRCLTMNSQEMLKASPSQAL